FLGGIVGSGSGTAAVSNAASGVGAASTTSPLVGGRLASTSCSASDSPPNHAPEPATAASGNVRPPPARCEMLYTVGALKKRAEPSRAPFAGLMNGSSSVSASAI